jgi:hypothetical protein
MVQVKDIENAVKKLTAKDLRRFRQWFAAFDAKAWDAQIEADVASGKLDTLAKAALDDFKNGNAKEF